MEELIASTTHLDRRALQRAARVERDFDDEVAAFNAACVADCAAHAERDAGEASAPPAFAAALRAAALAALEDWPAPSEAAADPEPGENEFLARLAGAIAEDQRARARVAVFDLLARADRASLPLMVPLHQRVALQLRRAARRAREQILSLLRERLHAPHPAALARLQRAGRVLPRSSAGPKISDN